MSFNDNLDSIEGLREYLFDPKRETALYEHFKKQEPNLLFTGFHNYLRQKIRQKTNFTTELNNCKGWNTWKKTNKKSKISICRSSNSITTQNNTISKENIINHRKMEKTPSVLKTLLKNMSTNSLSEESSEESNIITSKEALEFEIYFSKLEEKLEPNLHLFFKWNILSFIDQKITGIIKLNPKQEEFLFQKLPDTIEEFNIWYPTSECRIRNKNKKKSSLLSHSLQYFSQDKLKKQSCYTLSLEMNSENTFSLLPVQSNFTCRATRFYGSENFLSVNIPNDMKIPEKINLQRPYSLGIWNFLYCKIEKRKAFYIRVDSGAGSSSNLSPNLVRAWFVPIPANRHLSLSKYNARMSLSFTPTIMIGKAISIEKFTIDKDINHSIDKNSSADMTDGCGLISSSFLEEVVRELNLPKAPSAIQGRFGACKGVRI